jgi:glycosyltransferase involved in cell wall biosynthesis
MSGAMENDAISFGIPQNRIHQVMNGVEVDRFLPLPENRVKERVIYVGRINHQKGIDILLKSWKMIVNKGYNYKLFIAGPLQKDKYADNLLEYIKKNRLQRTTTFMGEINYYSHDLVEFFQSGDIFVLPSRREGMPGTLLQAMSCGLPVVATKVSGATDIVLDRINGRIVDIENEKELSDAIIELLEIDERTKNEMGLANRNTIIKKFDQSKRTKLFVNIFKRVLNTN